MLERLFRRQKSLFRGPSSRPHPRSRHLHLEVLEARLAPAVFTENAGQLDLVLDQAGETVNIVSAGASYTLTLNGANVWSGTNNPGSVIGNGTGALVVTADAFEPITITDASTGNAVTFDNSGANTYTDTFLVTLDDATAGSITFNGTTAFDGVGPTASTVQNVVVSPGATVSRARRQRHPGRRRRYQPGGERHPQRQRRRDAQRRDKRGRPQRQQLLAARHDHRHLCAGAGRGRG